MAHRVPNHKSKCQNLHGHRYKIEVGVHGNLVATPGASDEGMVIDFSDLKQTMMIALDEQYDHNSVFYDRDPIKLYIEDLQQFQQKKIHFVPFIPTAENLAEHWYKIMKVMLMNKGIVIHHVKVWETPTSTAFYEE